ncbi:glycosyltransferase family 39 protein [Ancylobacter sp. FA202]|uniref:ArnT family glycosyltransferase n=1 Tax=Ancylobacter sp. FA202 TaxID=1111106 RepID=UPI0003671E3E|nr:glycosyltransferase family 39 protein [Ancylobacter sp. FA202]
MSTLSAGPAPASSSAGDIATRGALALIGLMLVWRLVLAAFVPLVPDEAYYALWAQGLSAGYVDHPPMIAFFIRAGQMLLGDTPLGVRLFSVLAALPASWFVWRAAEDLLEDRRAGALAAVLFNATIFGFLGMTLATPDAPLALFCAAMVWCAARLVRAPRPLWWLAMGLATGLAAQSKYSGAMLAGAFSLAVLALAPLRRQLLTPWPWLAALLALLVFLPNIAWNAAHDWATLTKQGGRVTAQAPFRPGFLPEFVGSQIGLATPLIFLFAVLGLLPRRAAAAFRPGGGRALVMILLFVPLAYFAVHALRSRVEGNWVGFLYPLVAIAAAAGMLAPAGSGWAGRNLPGLARATLPLAFGLILALGIHALFVPTTLAGNKDAVLRMTRGWPEFAAEIDAKRRAIGASAILTNDYQMTSMLKRELPGVTVQQFDERQRYAFMDEPEVLSLPGPLLLVLSTFRSFNDITGAFGGREDLGEVSRRFRDVTMPPVRLFRLDPVETPAPDAPAPPVP